MNVDLDSNLCIKCKQQSLCVTNGSSIDTCTYVRNISTCSLVGKHTYMQGNMIYEINVEISLDTIFCDLICILKVI